MPINEQTLAELNTQCLANKEDELSTTVPTSPRSFLRVESVVQAAQLKSLEKRSVEAQKACLASTAMIEGLKVIGRDYGLEQDPAVATQLNLRAVATGGSSISAGLEMTSDATGAYYKVNALANEAAGVINFIVTATDPGEAANLDNGETLTFTAPVSGVTDPSIIQSTSVVGSEKQTTASFRAEVLAAERGAGGGGNTFDYRDRAETISGVANAFVYSGRPITYEKTTTELTFLSSDNSINSTRGFFQGFGFGDVFPGDVVRIVDSTYNNGFLTVQSATEFKLVVVENIVDQDDSSNLTITNVALPGDRTVFIESEDTTVEGVPTESLLDNVRDYIEEDADGTAWPDMGDIESTLYVEPITRTSFYVEIYNLSVDATQLLTLQAKVVEDLGIYFTAVRPFIAGLDFEMDRLDTVTDLAVSKVVQDVLDSFGASADAVVLRADSASAETFTSYRMGQGQLGKLGAVFDNDGSTWV